MNIVSISKEYVCVFADDERIFKGSYKELKMKKGYFEQMKNFAKENKRLELTDILKTIHKENKKILYKDPFISVKGHLPLEESTELRSYFFNAEPILEWLRF